MKLPFLPNHDDPSFFDFLTAHHPALTPTGRSGFLSSQAAAEPMRGAKVFPPLAVQMVAIGEKAGALESMLSKVADYFDRDSDYMIRNLTPLIEPFMILMLAFLVMLLALGVFLPMWDMVKFIK